MLGRPVSRSRIFRFYSRKGASGCRSGGRVTPIFFSSSSEGGCPHPGPGVAQIQEAYYLHPGRNLIPVLHGHIKASSCQAPVACSGITSARSSSISEFLLIVPPSRGRSPKLHKQRPKLGSHFRRNPDEFLTFICFGFIHMYGKT